ncbi:hypothetical protein BASA81_010539 [Batrachochytrium salamandrivorans]|nr:hypothetical protein BASA81_010539 [Batrachochytrium salamandrivorans]
MATQALLRRVQNLRPSTGMGIKLDALHQLADLLNRAPLSTQQTCINNKDAIRSLIVLFGDNARVGQAALFALLPLSTKEVLANKLVRDHPNLIPLVVKKLEGKLGLQEDMPIILHFLANLAIGEANVINLVSTLPGLVSFLVSKLDGSDKAMVTDEVELHCFNVLECLGWNSNNRKEMMTKYPKLLRMLFAKLLGDGVPLATQEKALVVLEYLSFDAPCTRLMMTKHAKIMPLLLVKLDSTQRRNTEAIQLRALGVLKSLAYDRFNRLEMLAKYPALMPLLVSKLESQSNSEELQLASMLVLSMLSYDSVIASNMLTSYANTLVPVLITKLKGSTAQGAATVLYYLSCPPGNRAVLETNNVLLHSLRNQQRNQFDDAQLFSFLCLCNLLDPRSNNYVEELTPAKDLLHMIFVLIQPAMDKSKGWKLSHPLLALSRLSVIERNRTMLWYMYQDKFLDDVLVALAYAIQDKDVDAAELAVAVLGEFARDDKPALWFTTNKPKLSEQMAKLDDSGAFRGASQLANSLLAKFIASTTDAAIPRSIVAGEDHVLPPLLVASLKTQDWKEFLRLLPQIDDLTYLLYVTINCEAPLEVIEYLVCERGVDLMEDYPLFLAIDQRRMDVANLLLDNGADIHATLPQGFTPLIRASVRDELLPLVQRLLDMGSDIDYCSPQNGMCALTASFAFEDHVQCTRLLLERGANANLTPPSTLSPLHSAVGKGKLEAAKLLLEHGAEVNTVAVDGHAIFNRLAKASEAMEEAAVVDMLDLLLQHGAKVASPLPPALEMPSLPYACTSQAREFPRLVRRLIEAGFEMDTALLGAVEMGRMYDLELFLQLGADPNAVIQGSCLFSHCLRVQVPVPNVSEVIKTLILAGADIDHSTDQRGSLLWYAAALGNLDVVWLLVQAGASKSQRHTSLRPFDAAKVNGHMDLLPLLAEPGDKRMCPS